MYIGNVTVVAQLENLVSEIELKYEFLLVEIIEKIIVKASSPENPDFVKKLNDNRYDINLPTDSKFVLSLSVNKGSSVTYRAYFENDIMKTAKSASLLAALDEVKIEHSFSLAGEYNTTVAAFNSLSLQNTTIYNIKVYDKVQDLDVNLRYIDDAEFSIVNSNLSLVQYSQIYSGFKNG